MDTSDQFCLVYITAADGEEARRIARAVVEERLAACANVLSGHRAFYWWQGKLEEGEEGALVVKTRRALLDALTARVKALHSYTVPCLVALPIVAGNPDYLRWLAEETRGPDPERG